METQISASQACSRDLLQQIFPQGYLLCGDGKQLGGGIRALASHFPGGSTVSSSRNTSIPAMMSSWFLACRATLWKSCGDIQWVSCKTLHSAAQSSSPSFPARKVPIHFISVGTPRSYRPSQNLFFFFFLISLFSYFRIFLFSCFLILGNGSCRPALSPASPTAACRGGALVSSALPRSTPSAQDNCCTRLTSSVSSVAMALPIS